MKFIMLFTVSLVYASSGFCFLSEKQMSHLEKTVDSRSSTALKIALSQYKESITSYEASNLAFRCIKQDQAKELLVLIPYGVHIRSAVTYAFQVNSIKSIAILEKSPYAIGLAPLLPHILGAALVAVAGEENMVPVAGIFSYARLHTVNVDRPLIQEALRKAAREGRRLMVKTLVEKAYTVAPTSGALQAAINGYADAYEEDKKEQLGDFLEIIRFLVQKAGVDPNYANAGDQLPLFLAAEHQVDELFKLLVSLGATPPSVEPIAAAITKYVEHLSELKEGDSGDESGLSVMDDSPDREDD